MIMIDRATRPLTRRVLMVDDQLAQPTTAGGRAMHGVADELRARGMEVVEARTFEDGLATVVSDAAIHCLFITWTLGKHDKESHEQATDLLRALRARNSNIPIFLTADRKVTGTVTVEVATHHLIRIQTLDIKVRMKREPRLSRRLKKPGDEKRTA